MKRILLLDACNFDFFFQWIFLYNKEKKPFALLYDLSTILIQKYTKSLAHATPKMLNDFLFHFVIWNALKNMAESQIISFASLWVFQWMVSEASEKRKLNVETVLFVEIISIIFQSFRKWTECFSIGNIPNVCL